MTDSPENGPLEFLPFAAGLTDQDVQELLALIRARTDRKILLICSKREDAEVVTGHLADDLLGDGEIFQCARADKGWKIKETNQWNARKDTRTPGLNPGGRQESAPMNDFPEFDPLDFLPFASGLADRDTQELLRLIRTKSDRKILEIRSKRHGAEVITGFLADGETGGGENFRCVRTEQDWRITEATEWIA